MHIIKVPLVKDHILYYDMANTGKILKTTMFSTKIVNYFNESSEFYYLHKVKQTLEDTEILKSGK